MIERVRNQILGYLLGALDDSEMEYVAERLENDPLYQEQLPHVRRQLQSLGPREPLDDDPPPDLAARTLDRMFARADRKHSRPRRPRSLSPAPAGHSWSQSGSWLDAAVAVSVFLLAAVAIWPAVFDSRVQVRLAACQDNLRQMGMALADYSRRHGDCFPQVPREGRLAVAGIYAPTLVSEGYLTEPHRVLCPESATPRQRAFRMPTLAEIQAASPVDLVVLRQQIGGSYGYTLGHQQRGVLRPTRNLSRSYFAIMADAPCAEMPGRQSRNHGGHGQNVLLEDGHVEFVVHPQSAIGPDDIFANDAQHVAVGMHCDDSVIATSETEPVVELR